MADGRKGPGGRWPSNPARPQREAKPPKLVWVACRAKDGCEGKQAFQISSTKLPAGGTAHRYRCTTCGGTFHIVA